MLLREQLSGRQVRGLWWAKNGYKRIRTLNCLLNCLIICKKQGRRGHEPEQVNVLVHLWDMGTGNGTPAVICQVPTTSCAQNSLVVVTAWQITSVQDGGRDGIFISLDDTSGVIYKEGKQNLLTIPLYKRLGTYSQRWEND